MAVCGRDRRSTSKTWSGSAALDRAGTEESTCADWLDASLNANIGNFSVTQSQFWSAGGTGPCSASNSLICIAP
jgi:hypothetical protein